MQKKKAKKPLLRQKKSIMSHKVLLLTKQKIKHFYGFLKEKELKKIFYTAKKKKQKTFLENIIILLETRLDVLLYRAQFTKTIRQAQQQIKHKKIKILKQHISNKYITKDYKTTKKNNYNVKPGDLIIKKYKLNHTIKKTPTNILLSKKKNQLMLLFEPNLNQLYLPFLLTPNQKIKTYSKQEMLKILLYIYL